VKVVLDVKKMPTKERFAGDHCNVVENTLDSIEAAITAEDHVPV
jgi:hypothetical protein